MAKDNTIKSSAIKPLVVDVTTTQISKDISDKIRTNEDVIIAHRDIKLIIEYFLNSKKDILLQGYTVREPGIAEYTIVQRKLPASFSTNKFTAKLRSALDTDLKELAKERILNSEIINK